MLFACFFYCFPILHGKKKFATGNGRGGGTGTPCHPFSAVLIKYMKVISKERGNLRDCCRIISIVNRAGHN